MPIPKMKTFDSSWREILPQTILGTHTGALKLGCWSARIELENGVTLMFEQSHEVPKELRPETREEAEEGVPVTVRVYKNAFEQIVYDAERISKSSNSTEINPTA